jgi:hypothetical protein
MSIIKSIGGKQVLPVWALPYVMVNGWCVLVGFEDAILSLNHQSRGRIVPKFLTAYKTDYFSGEVSPIPAIEWDKYLTHIAEATKGLQDKESFPNENYLAWLDVVAKEMPTRCYVCRDEFEDWYYAAIEKNVDEDDRTIFVTKVLPTGVTTVRVPYYCEDYKLVIDPVIPDAILEKHKAWQNIAEFSNHQSSQGLALTKPSTAKADKDGDHCDSDFVYVFAERLRIKAGRKETREDCSLLLRDVACYLERLPANYHGKSIVYRCFEGYLLEEIETQRRANDGLKREVLGGILECWRRGEKLEIQALTGEPATTITLEKFLQALENFRNRLGRNPYLHLPPHEAVYFLLSSQLCKPSTPLRRRVAAWGDCAWQDPNYRLKLFDGKGGAVEVAPEALRSVENLPEDLFVRLDNLAPLFLSKTGNYYQCLPLPWCSKEGDLILLTHPEATKACKKEFISYLSAERFLMSRFPDTTREEIALWLDFDEITARTCEYSIAKTIRFNYGMDHYGCVHGEERPSLEEVLMSLYFSVSELKEANPTRWKSYERLKNWAEEHGMDENMLIAAIKLNSFEFDYRIGDPVRRSKEEEKAATIDDKIKQALYHPDFLALLEEEYFRHSPEIDLVPAMQADEFTHAQGESVFYHGNSETETDEPFIQLPEIDCKLTIADERKCQDWLVSLMFNGSECSQNTQEIFKEAKANFPGLSIQAYRRARGNAISETGNHNWDKPGRKPKKKS